MGHGQSYALPVGLQLVVVCLAASSKREVDVGALAAIREAAGRIEDWEGFVNLVCQHRVGALVSHALGLARIALPDHAASRLERLAQQAAYFGLAASREIARMQAICHERGIPFAILKGVPLSMRLHSSVGLRQARDIDVFVEQARVVEVIRVLMELGYVPCEIPPNAGDGLTRLWYGARKDLSLLNKEAGILTELHWRLVANEQLLDLPFDPARLESVSLSLQSNVPVLRLEDEFVYLCVHGATHFWMRLKWLADIHAMLAVLSDKQIYALYSHAVALNAGSSVGLALLLCARIFGTHVPADLLASFARSPVTRVLSWISLREILFRNRKGRYKGPSKPLLPRILQVMLKPDYRYLKREIGLLFSNPTEFITFGLPDGFAPVYPLLRPGLWLLAQLGVDRKRRSAVRSWGA